MCLYGREVIFRRDVLNDVLRVSRWGTGGAPSVERLRELCPADWVTPLSFMCMAGTGSAPSIPPSGRGVTSLSHRMHFFVRKSTPPQNRQLNICNSQQEVDDFVGELPFENSLMNTLCQLNPHPQSQRHFLKSIPGVNSRPEGGTSVHPRRNQWECIDYKASTITD